MSKLKPCPFCESELRIERNNSYWWVRCSECQYLSDYLATEEQAFELANTRPIEDTQAAEIERLKIENARMREVLLICANENASEWDCCGTRRYHKRLAIKALKDEG